MMRGTPSLTIVVLTYNEEIHIERCLRSAASVAGRIVVVDSFSTDRTVEIARSLGTEVFQHVFVNHATQLNWALEHLDIATDWVMRLDADEIIGDNLAGLITDALDLAPEDTTGFEILRQVKFMGGIIRHGNFPQWNLRIWRNNQAEVEQRWMDEHIVLKSGRARRLRGEITDDNLNSITWWTAKHNNYASREAVELLNIKHDFMPAVGRDKSLSANARIKRMVKTTIYSRLAPGLRSVAYFMYRYIFQLGVLDGRRGFAFHFLQGFWYRFLVDVKVWEVERRMRADGIDCVEAIRRELGIELNRADAPAPAPSN